MTALRKVTRGLVDISGQHEHYSLLEAEGHVDIVDRFAELADEGRQMAEAYGEVRRLRGRLEELRGDVRERLNRIDFLEYQLSEIDEAAPEAGELEELQEEFNRLKHAEEIGESAQKALHVSYEGNDSAVEKLSVAQKHLADAARHDPELDELAERLDEARIEAEELSLELQDYLADVDVDPARLDSVIERMDLLNRLKRKHDAADLEDLVARADEMREEIDTLQNAEARTAELEDDLEEAERNAFEVARNLSEERRMAAERLQSRVERELTELNMESTRFIVRFDPEQLPEADAALAGDIHHEEDASEDGQQSLLQGLTLSETGFDEIEFLISPNIGEEARPLAKIASGGELSRIMLAIKSVLMERDSVESYIFDEVDTGIGGTTADVVGEKIRRTADTHQTVCITHLAQIASRGDFHYRVEKTERDGRTHSKIEQLAPEERVEEITRMLGGSSASEKTREAARDLLSQHD